jgi:hypothetical protein
MGEYLRGEMTVKGLGVLCGMVEEMAGVRKQYVLDGQTYSTVRKGSLLEALQAYAPSSTSEANGAKVVPDYTQKVWDGLKAKYSHMSPWSSWKFPGLRAPTNFQVHASLREVHELKPLFWSDVWNCTDLAPQAAYRLRTEILAKMTRSTTVTEDELK